MDHGPVKAEGEGLEPPSGPCRRLFSRQVPHPAGCLPTASCGGWNRTNIKAFRAPRLTVRRPRRRSISPTRVGATVFAKSSGGRNRTCGLLIQSQASLPAATTPDQPRVPCGNRTRLASLEGWSLCRSAKGTWIKAEREGVEPSRLIARPLSKRLPSPIGLPFHRQHRQQESNLRRVSS